MLAVRHPSLRSAEFFQSAREAIAYHESNWALTTRCDLAPTLFRTKPISVLRAMILTS